MLAGEAGRCGRRMKMPPEFLVDAVCYQFGITQVELRAGERRREFIDARKVLVHALTAIGIGPLQGSRIMARDHATFIHHRAIPLDSANAETLLDAQRAAARRWSGQMENYANAMQGRRAAARKTDKRTVSRIRG